MTNGKVTVLPSATTAKATIGQAGAGANVALAAVEAVKTIVEAVMEHQHVKQANMTARQAIDARASVLRDQIAANRKTLDKYVKRTFAGRDAGLSSLMENLDKAVETGNVELAKSIADNIANVVKSGPLIQVAELQQTLVAEQPVFHIGKKT